MLIFTTLFRKEEKNRSYNLFRNSMDCLCFYCTYEWELMHAIQNERQLLYSQVIKCKRTRGWQSNIEGCYYIKKTKLHRNVCFIDKRRKKISTALCSYLQLQFLIWIVYVPRYVKKTKRFVSSLTDLILRDYDNVNDYSKGEALFMLSRCTHARVYNLRCM